MRRKSSVSAMPSCVPCCPTGNWNIVSLRRARASLAASVEELGSCVRKLLSKASRLSEVQEERPASELSCPARIRGRQPERAHQIAETGMDALPQIARHPG